MGSPYLNYLITGGILCSLLVSPLKAQPVLARQRQALTDLQRLMVQRKPNDISRRVTLADSTWTDWQHRTGELPPDFEQLPSIPFLPEPLELSRDGKAAPIRTVSEWREKRAWIKAQFQHWISGKVPPAPDRVGAEVLSERREGGVRIQLIRLSFGPDNAAKMTLELLIPERKGPLPVYMTQWNHRGWAQLAVKRGYIGCVYAAADDKDDTQAYQRLYPDYDFSGLMRRAWGASRVVDYLLTRPDVNRQQIAITGHSRNGKQSLWAAAFDERIAAVISSSCGTGGITPWRFSDPQYCTQTIDDICSNATHWFHPRLRFFFGREDKLPVDQNLLLALIAPRVALYHYSMVERQLNPWVNEQCFRSVKKVYDFLGAGDKVDLFPRLGEHAVMTRDLERCLDFLDNQFGRNRLPWQSARYYDYSFDEWAKGSAAGRADAGRMQPVSLAEGAPDTAMFRSRKRQIQQRLTWLLGEEPPGVKPDSVGPTIASRMDWIDAFTGRPSLKGAASILIGPYTAMGAHLSGILYSPQNPPAGGGKRPVVVYLHQYAYAHGYALGYSAMGGRGNTPLFQRFIDQGFAVLAIDQIGFGTRIEEGQYFYRRFPEWSKMGQMISDVRACVDALTSFDTIDSRRIFLLGNTLGGSLALMAAALDERIAGVAVVAAFSPWRTESRTVESLQNFSHRHGLMPRLGLFADNPGRVPVDFGEIMACIAPRPLLVMAPELDRYADLNAVKSTMGAVGKVYASSGRPGALVFQTPREINRITEPMLDEIIQFFTALQIK